MSTSRHAGTCKEMPTTDVFPTLFCCSQFSKGGWSSRVTLIQSKKVTDVRATTDTLYDVKFYPYATADNDQIFAVTGERDVGSQSSTAFNANWSQVFICRPMLDADPPFELLRWFKDEDVSQSPCDKFPRPILTRILIAGCVVQQPGLDETSNNSPTPSLCSRPVAETGQNP